MTKKNATAKAKHVIQIRKQKKPPLTGAQRQKNYRDRKNKAFEEKTLNRKQLNQYHKERNRRASKNNPILCQTSSSTSKATIEWMNESQTIQGQNYKHIATHMRHASTPSFVFGGVDPVTAKDTGNREVYFLDDNNRWQHWIDKKRSAISGFGIFAARTFKAGAIVTRYMGTRTSSVAVSKSMFKKSKGYVFKFQTKNNKDMWVAPDLSKPYLYGHFLNHSNEPNCVVDRQSGIITAIYQVNKGEELLIDYGDDYVWST
jgi:hypothetical protein